VNWRAIWAIVRRDLRVVRGSRAVMGPLLIMPALFVVVFPLLAGLIARIAVPPGELAELTQAAPPQLMDSLPGSSGAKVAAFFLIYLLPPFTLIVPLVVVMVLATDAVAGERERGTLEALLLAPVTDRELLVAKLGSALVPALTVSAGSQVIYLLITDVMMWPVAHGPLLPTLHWLLIAVWLGPALSAAALSLAVLISARSRTVQGAQQIAGLAVLPTVALVVGQFTGLLFLSTWLSLLTGLVLLAVAALLVRFGARALTRDRLGPRLT
jgi:ABC-type Na+ efflux pump permease subunit